MDRLACHIIYVDRAVGEDRFLQPGPRDPAAGCPPHWKNHRVRELVPTLLATFGDVHVCATGAACMSKMLHLLQSGSIADMTPTLVLLDVPHDDSTFASPLSPSSSSPPLSSSSSSTHPQQPQQPRSPASADVARPTDDLYGLALLHKLTTEAHVRGISKLVLAVPIISHPLSGASSSSGPMMDGTNEAAPASQAGTLAAHRRLIRKCLDLGACDVITSPLSPKCLTTLEICAYKARRDAKDHPAHAGSLQSYNRFWASPADPRPFSYLREAMVLGLTTDICRLEAEDGLASLSPAIVIAPDRKAAISEAIGRWHFCAHSFSDDELLFASAIIFEHAFSLAELEPWRLPTDQLMRFLVACRAAYNGFVPYHNFRHVVDVLQATFHFLVEIGALPPYPYRPHSESKLVTRSPVAALLRPIDALTLLVTAIGHDVGHPGVNNGFLATLNTPLAQLYNDRSVLESFHCAAYSQILRRHWPVVYEDRKMRQLMISSILSTDMGLHFDYMKKLGDLQEKIRLHAGTNGWDSRQLDEGRVLACSLLIKCADISNVARHHDTALRWMYILSDEFSRQASMEEELQIKSSLLAPPKSDLVSLATAQLGFMNLFAMPLFHGVTDILPAMSYTVEELKTNKILFERKVQDEAASPLPAATSKPGAAVKLAEDDERRQRAVTGEVPRGGPRPASKEGAPTRNQKLQPPPSSPTRWPRAAPKEERLGGLGKARGQGPDGAMAATSSTSAAAAVASPSSSSLSSFDVVRELADSDPFHCRDRAPGAAAADETASTAAGPQRCSETTDGSTSGVFAGDWQSQATSTATGKAALSPSTKGTSIVSSDSIEHGGGGGPGPELGSATMGKHGSPDTVRRHDEAAEGEEGPRSSGGTIGKAEAKGLKKKPSRFRMKDFPFFRRNKGTSPPLPAEADATTNS